METRAHGWVSEGGKKRKTRKKLESEKARFSRVRGRLNNNTGEERIGEKT